MAYHPSSKRRQFNNEFKLSSVHTVFYTYINTYIYIYISIYIYIHTHTHTMYIHTHTHTHINIYTYTECPWRNVPHFGRVFLLLKYTDITQNTYIQS
jgi:hypothetical protein